MSLLTELKISCGFLLQRCQPYGLKTNKSPHVKARLGIRHTPNLVRAKQNLVLVTSSYRPTPKSTTPRARAAGSATKDSELRARPFRRTQALGETSKSAPAPRHRGIRV